MMRDSLTEIYKFLEVKVARLQREGKWFDPANSNVRALWRVVRALQNLQFGAAIHHFDTLIVSRDDLASVVADVLPHSPDASTILWEALLDAKRRITRSGPPNEAA
jgi:hypothetical protein